MTTFFHTLWKEIWTLIVEAGRLARSWKWGIGLYVLLVAGGAFLLWHFDQPIHGIIEPQKEGTALSMAGPISYWGDFPTGILLVSVLMYAGGMLWKSKRFRQAALACLLAAAFAGILVNCLRLTVGRPRPSAGKIDGFYGLHTSADYHSFPSGHAATGFGSGMAVAVAIPPLAPVGVATGFIIGWSRMKLDRHWATDIFVGGSIGLLCGVLFGIAARKNALGEEIPAGH